MQDATELFVWGCVIHLVADWLLQNEWMATHKIDLRHPAAWVHSGIHTAAMLLVFAWPAALVIGLSHLWIDTRQPLTWWLRIIKQMPTMGNHQNVELWVDQVMHVTVLAGVALALDLWW
jgi:hypothetical protein